MRRADKEFLNAQIENLKESAHERFATVLMQVDYLQLKLLNAERGCKKLREENRRLREILDAIGITYETFKSEFHE